MSEFDKFRKLCGLVVLLVLTGFCICGQEKKNEYVGESFFLKNSLIFMGYPQTPKITSEKITFTGRYSENDQIGSLYSSPLIHWEERVTIKEIKAEKNPATVVFEYKGKLFNVYVSNKSKKDFAKSFELAFSKDEFRAPVCGDDIRTRKQLFNCYGFPVYVQKEGGQKRYFYFYEFVPDACQGRDGCWITVTKKGLEISGYN